MILSVFKRRRLLSGEMSEWLKEPVLKTGGMQVPVGSNPTLSANFNKSEYLRKYPSGRRGSPAKGVGWIKPARGFKSLLPRQLRNSHHRSVSGFAENCAMMGISSLSAPIRFAGFGAEGDGGRRDEGRRDERRETKDEGRGTRGGDRKIGRGIFWEWGLSAGFLADGAVYYKG